MLVGSNPTHSITISGLVRSDVSWVSLLTIELMTN